MSRESGVLTVYNPKTTVLVIGFFTIFFIICVFFIASAYLDNPGEPKLGIITLPPLSGIVHVEIPTPQPSSTPPQTVTAFPTLSPEHLDQLMVELNKLDAPQEVLDELQQANELREE